MSENPVGTLSRIAQILYDKKAKNILAVDVHGLSSITDYLLIAEGNIERHVSSMAKSVVQELEKEGGPPLLHAEGLQAGDWVVLDYGEIMIHLFKPHLREHYALERLWPESSLIELEIDASHPAMGDSGA